MKPRRRGCWLRRIVVDGACPGGRLEALFVLGVDDEQDGQRVTEGDAGELSGRGLISGKSCARDVR